MIYLFFKVALRRRIFCQHSQHVTQKTKQGVYAVINHDNLKQKPAFCVGVKTKHPIFCTGDLCKEVWSLPPHTKNSR